jgi:hypothetical protein
VSIPISGQNERWAHLNAHRPPPVSPSGQNSGPSSAGATTASTSSTGSAPATGGTSVPLSDGMSFMLMAVSSVNGPKGAGQSDGTPNASAPVDQTGATQGGADPASQLFTHLQSLLSALTGTPGASTGGTGTTAIAASPANTGTSQAIGLSNTVQQDLQTISSDLDSIASTSGSAQPGSASRPPSGPPPWRNDISNTGTNVASATGSTNGTGGADGTNRWRPGYSDGFQQQFAISAYTTSTTSALNSSVTTSLTNINV